MDVVVKLQYGDEVIDTKKTYGEIAPYSDFIASIPAIQSTMSSNTDVNNILSDPIDIGYLSPYEKEEFVQYIINPSKQNYEDLNENVIGIFGLRPSPKIMWLADIFEYSREFSEIEHGCVIWDTSSSMKEKIDNLIAYIQYFGIVTAAVYDFDEGLIKYIIDAVGDRLPNTTFNDVNSNIVSELHVIFSLKWILRDGYYPQIVEKYLYCFHMEPEEYPKPVVFKMNSQYDTIGDRELPNGALPLTEDLRFTDWSTSVLRYHSIPSTSTQSLYDGLPIINTLDNTIIPISKIDFFGCSDCVFITSTNYPINTSTLIESGLNVSNISIDACRLNLSQTVNGLSSKYGEKFSIIHRDKSLIGKRFVFILTPNNKSSLIRLINAYYRDNEVMIMY